MIRVLPAPEPAGFDEKVRQPGLEAIRELVGEARACPRRGRPREKVADSREEIPSEEFPPYWREALPQMLEAYGRICAYLSLFIEPATGSASVDHMLPKSRAWHRVYEWDNYRLAAALVNARKGDLMEVLDPFEIEDGWFALELVDFQVKPGSEAQGALKERVEHTIAALGLNDQLCRQARGAYVENYLNGDISFAFLARRAPFVARELRRQQRLLPKDR